MILVETSIFYEKDNHESRMIDNSKGNGIVRRKLSISRKWNRAFDLSEENTITKSSVEGVSIGGLLALYAKMSELIEEKYNISETQSFSEEIEIEIMPFSKIQINIEWKGIWQKGFFEASSSNGEIIKLPYKVCKGITFDLSQEQIN